MDRMTRCLHCGRGLVPILNADGRTELKCAWCDKVDPMETAAPNGPIAHSLSLFPRQPLKGTGPQ